MNQDVSSHLGVRIALVTGVLKAGGATTFLCNFAGELRRRNIPVMVQSFENDNPHARDFERLGVNVQTHNHRRLIFEDRLIAIYKELARFRPTVVIANLGAMSFEVLRYLPDGVVRVGVAHGDQDGIYQMLGRYAPWLDIAAAVSKTIQSKLMLMPEFSDKSVCYLSLGVPIPDQISSSVREANRPLGILFLGRLERLHKRAHLLPEMLCQLQDSKIPFHWTIVGDGPEKPALVAKMKCVTAGQSVHFAGQICYNKIPELLARHDVFLLTSETEGLPLSLLETMGHGLVPVVSDLPSGIRELVDETNGFRIPAHELHEYMNAIIRLHLNRDELAAKSAAARNRVINEFSVTAMADRWLDAFFDERVRQIEWPATINLQQMVCEGSGWIFCPPARWLRRIAIKVRPRK